MKPEYREWASASGAFVTHYLGVLEPDIRYAKIQRPDPLTFLDQRVNEKGDFVFLVSVRAQVKNMGWRSGFIDKADFVPLAIETIPTIEIKYIDKRPIGWRDVQDIEVRALMVLPAGSGSCLAITHLRAALNRFTPLAPSHHRYRPCSLFAQERDTDVLVCNRRLAFRDGWF